VGSGQPFHSFNLAWTHPIRIPLQDFPSQEGNWWWSGRRLIRDLNDPRNYEAQITITTTLHSTLFSNHKFPLELIKSTLSPLLLLVGLINPDTFYWPIVLSLNRLFKLNLKLETRRRESSFFSFVLLSHDLHMALFFPYEQFQNVPFTPPILQLQLKIERETLHVFGRRTQQP